MTINNVAAKAKWKIVYEEMWRKTPKSRRRTKRDIKYIRGMAKCHVEQYQ